MNKNILICLLLAISSTLVDCDDVCSGARELSEKIVFSILKIGLPWVVGESEISHSRASYRQEAIAYKETVLDDLRKEKGLSPTEDLCEFEYLNKALADTHDEIHTCEKTVWKKFTEKTLFGIPLRAKNFLTELDSVCNGSHLYDNRRLSNEMRYLMMTTSVEKMREHAGYVETNTNALEYLDKAIDSCANEALRRMKASVSRDLKKYTDCEQLNASIKWYKP